MTKITSLKISVASGKGGTGKTMLSTNLALYLSQTQNTLLVDLDVEEPNDFVFISGTTENISHQYKMIPAWDESKCEHCGICSKNCKFHAVIQLGNNITIFNRLCHSCYACSELCPANALPMQKYKIGEIKTIVNKRLIFLEGRLDIGEEQAVPLINQTHQLVNKDYNAIPYQIFDCPPGTSCPVVASCKYVDFVILVTEPTPFGLNDLILAVETMRKLNKLIGVVINRYGIGNADVEKYCIQEQIIILAKIPYDKKIAKYYSQGKLVFDKIELMSDLLQNIINTIEKQIGI